MERVEIDKFPNGWCTRAPISTRCQCIRAQRIDRQLTQGLWKWPSITFSSSPYSAVLKACLWFSGELFELMCHSVICVHRPVECEGRIPPRPCNVPRRAGRQHTELNGELRDSDGLELICLCCWCYACFIFGNRGVPLSLFFLAFAYVSVCLSLNLSYISVSLLWLRCDSWLLLWMCAAGQRGWVHAFQWSSHRGPHFGAEDWICSLKHTQAWNVHCEQQHSGPRLFNRKPQRFMFTFILLSFIGFCHVAFKKFGIVVCVCVFWCQVGGGWEKYQSSPDRGSEIALWI